MNWKHRMNIGEESGDKRDKQLGASRRLVNAELTMQITINM